MSPARKNRLTASFFLLLNSALWGISAPIIKHSLNFTSPAIFLFYRFCIATVVFLPFYLAFRKHKNKRTNYRMLVGLGLLGTPLTLLPLFYGLKLTSSIEASIIESSSPIFVILGGLLFLKEKISKKEWVGLLIAIAGTLILTIEPILNNHRITGFSLYGNMLILLSNVVWGAFLLLSKRDHVHPVELSFFSFLISVPFFFILALMEKESFALNLPALPGILFMAIGGSIIAFWAYQEGQRRIEASEAAIFTYLKPAFAIPLAIFWLHETLSPVAMIATALIIYGVYYSEKR